MQHDYYLLNSTYYAKDGILNIEKVHVSQINILVVDDCSTSSVLIRHQLQSLGVSQPNITCVNNASDALRAVKSRFYSFIILDYHLGERLTGVELLNLMLRSKLISQLTAVLMISGDARQETVLTSLSGHVRHFLKKPLQTKALNNKMKTAIQEQKRIAQVESELQQSKDLTLSQLAVVLEKHPNSVCVESLLIDTLVKRNNTSLLALFLPYCQYKEHASLICAQAYLLRDKGAIFQSIKLLADYVAKNPLCLRAVDNLAGLYESEGQLSNAFLMTERAFKATPSNSHRMLSVSRVASKLKQKDKLYDIGLTYATCLSPTDPNWLSTIRHYVSFVSELYDELTNQRDKRELLTKLNYFCEIAFEHLNQNQKADLYAVRLLMQCNLLLKESRPQEAHKKLLLAISLYYQNMPRCPITVIELAIPLMELFGEFELVSSLQLVLKHKQHKTNVEKGHQFSQNHTQESIPVDNFPFSIEAKLKHLLSQSGDVNHPEVKGILESLTQLALPPNWSMWVSDFLNGSKVSPLPKPFNLNFV